MIVFDNEAIEFHNLDLIIAFIRNIIDDYENVFVEFIGGEPLLKHGLIGYFLSHKDISNVKYQITTNGTLLNDKIYEEVVSKMDIINLSYNENYFSNNSLFSKISKILSDKQKVTINFIYDPKKDLAEIKKNFLFVLKNGYTNIKILPIVLVHSYEEKDFKQLIEFIDFTLIFKSTKNIGFIYYIQEKNGHFEFTIDPSGNILGDNMGTAENFFGVAKCMNRPIGKIGSVSLNEIIDKLKDYSYIDYLKNITDNGKSKQTYDNLFFLSNLLKKYDSKIQG